MISRRAGGLSIGVNLNPNAACNWRCVYCQVPGLTRGAAPTIDLELLAVELEAMLSEVLDGDYLERAAPAPYRRLVDVAFSGNGEPTTARDFAAAVSLVIARLRQRQLLGTVKIVVITNGSCATRPDVAAAFSALDATGGEIWFKLDAGTTEDLARINGIHLSPQRHLERLIDTSRRCKTWIQTCLFARDGAPPTAAGLDAYIAQIERALALGAPLAGVHLYTLARPPQQPDAARLAPLSGLELEPVAQRLRSLGLTVTVSP